MFPKTRARRLRMSEGVRRLVRETRLSPEILIMPLFVRHGEGTKHPIPSMPGQYQFSIDELLNEAKTITDARIGAVLLFGIPKRKDPLGCEATAPDGIVQQAVMALKDRFPDLVIFTDLCFCEYTDHGHCGVIKKEANGVSVDNDATLKLIEKAALAQAKAGTDFVAPSGMMDGAVTTIRAALDRAGYKSTGILSYAAKFASVFYGPFREAVQSAPQFGDRRSYQMDPANLAEAIREIREDLKEGADMVMVKPALPYLDILARIKPELDVPLVAYNVSGEYAMVKAAEKNGWLSGEKDQRAALEILTSIKRAGADLIVTYHALEVARLLD